MLEYRPIPYDLLKPMAGGQLIEGGQAYKPTFGSVGTLGVKFYMGKTYNETKSKIAGIESYDDEEMCEIQIDKFTKYTPRVRDLDRTQQRDLGGLLKVFREQKASNETQIIDWLIINENDRAFLTTQGVYTVEQLANFDPSEGYRFGGNGKDLIDKARQHLNGKVDLKAQEREQEYKMLLEEVSKLRAKEQEREEAELKRHEQLAKQDKSKGKQIEVSVNG